MLQGNVKTTNVLDYAKTFGLWLTTAVLAFLEIAVVRDIIFNLYARIIVAKGGVAQSANYFAATTLGQVSVVVMALLAIVVVIGGFEYHYKRVGEARSLKILLWTLGIQLVILLVYVLI